MVLVGEEQWGDQVSLVTAMRKVHLLIEAVADIGIILSSYGYWEFVHLLCEWGYGLGAHIMRI